MSAKIHFTPWGSPQTQKEIADGIVLVSTASHGGFFVSDEWLAKMPVDCRAAKTYAGKNWYEEDCDAATVVFPALWFCLRF